MTSEKPLYVFANDATDWVVAYDPNDAAQAYTESTGTPYSVEDDGEFVQCPDDAEMTIDEEATITPQPLPAGGTAVRENEEGHVYRATLRAWADCRGRGFLCSTEY
jgi:hypothetical protein